MSDYLIGGFYGLLTLVVVIVSFRGRSEDSQGASVILGLMWLASNAAYLWMPAPYFGFMPAMDASVLIFLTWIWRNRLQLWMIGLIAFLLGDMLVHANYLGAGDHSRAAGYWYNLRLNALYIGQLASVASANLRLARPKA